MKIRKIRLKNFRNYDELEIIPHEDVNLLFGQNGSGKTNLLEAIHYCALGKSHRVNHDRNTVMTGREMGACGIELSRKQDRCDIAVKMIPGDNVKKTIFIDKKKITRLSELMGRLQCVSFSPEDLDLVKGGPSVRRRYMDMLLSQINTGYFIALQQYRKALDQRNAILKNLKMQRSTSGDMLTDFEKAMAEPAEVIIRERKKIIEILNRYAPETYASVSGRENEIMTLEYQSSLKEEEHIKEAYLLMLEKNREEDIRYGTTDQGPHKDDLNIRLNGKGMKLFSSQGQIRTAALSMKLAQLKLYKDVTGDTPILLLDDVMSELDMTRRMHLLREIEGVQTFVTCTDESDLEGCENKRTYGVSLSPEGKAILREKNEGKAMEQETWQEPDFT